MLPPMLHISKMCDWKGRPDFILGMMICLECQPSKSECLFWVPGTWWFQFNFLVMHVAGNKWETSAWVLSTYVGNMDKVSICFLRQSATLTIWVFRECINGYYVCVCVFIHTYMYTYIHLHRYINKYTYIYVCVYNLYRYIIKWIWVILKNPVHGKLNWKIMFV